MNECKVLSLNDVSQRVDMLRGMVNVGNDLDAVTSKLTKRIDFLADLVESDAIGNGERFNRVDTALNAVKDVIAADREDIFTKMNKDRTSADETFYKLGTVVEKLIARVEKCEAELTCAYNTAMATTLVLERIAARLNRLEAANGNA